MTIGKEKEKWLSNFLDIAVQRVEARHLCTSITQTTSISGESELELTSLFYVKIVTPKRTSLR